MLATNPSNESPPPAQERYRAFAALRHRDFRLLWLGQIISVTGSQMQVVAINWHVYLLTRSPLALGMVGLFRGAPIIICSLIGGVVADAADRKRLMIMTQGVMLGSAAILTFATLTGLKSVWPIYILTGVSSAAVAFDIPARQALMPTLVPARDFANAVSLGLVVFNLATILGPSLGGLLLASRGPGAVYALNAVSFLAVIVALFLMRTSGRALPDNQQSTRVSFAALREGLSFVWHTPIIVQTMTLDFAAMFFGTSRIFWLSMLMLAITGAADTISTVLRQTIRQLATPNYLRGRMTSINMVFFMGGPQLGEVEAGLVAAFIGAPLSVITGGIGAVLTAVFSALKSRSLRDYHADS